MANTTKLYLDLEFDDNGAIKSVKKLGDEVKKTGAASKKTTDTATSSVMGYAKSIGVAAAAMVALNKTVQFLGESVKLAEEQEKQEYRVAQALRTRGLYSKEALDYLKAEASALQQVSTVGDETALSMQALALSMGASTSQAVKITNAAADMAIALGIDTESAVRNLAKTLGGYGGELSEVIPALKELTKEQLQAGEGVELIAGMFENMATDGVPPYTLAMSQLKMAWGDMQEEIGKIIIQNPEIIQSFRDMIDVVAGVGNVIRENKDTFSGYLGLIKAISPALMVLSEAAEVFQQRAAEQAPNATKALLEEIEVTQALVKEYEAQLAAGELTQYQRDRLTEKINIQNRALEGMVTELNKANIFTDEQTAKVNALAAAEKLAAEATAARAKAVAKLFEEMKNIELNVKIGRAEPEETGGAPSAVSSGITPEQQALLSGMLVFNELYAQTEAERYRVENEMYLAQMEGLAVAYEEGVITQEQRNQAELVALQAHEDAKAHIRATSAEGQKAADHVEIMGRMSQLGALAGATAAAISVAGGQSKSAFKASQAAAIASTLLQAPFAAHQSFVNGGGYPWGLIPMAASIVTSAAQLAKIKSQKPPEQPKVSGYAVGTPMVQQSGLANIHQGEAVIPARANPFNRDADIPMSGPTVNLTVGSVNDADTINMIAESVQDAIAEGRVTAFDA